MKSKSGKYNTVVFALVFLSIVSYTRSTVPASFSASTEFENQIPKIDLQNLLSMLNNPKMERSQMEALKDSGRKFGALEITGLGERYTNALQTLHSNAPKCIENNDELPDKIRMPDGSYRKT